MSTLSQASIIAIIGALTADELAKIRKKDSQLWKGRQWKSDTIITTASRAQGNDNEVKVDSFEWMSIASRVVDFFQLDSTGLEDYLLRVSSLGEWAEVVQTSREQGSKDITFSSSGSSGQPKKCSQRWDDLYREAEYFASYLGDNLGDNDAQIKRVISAVPPHHIYGFIFSVLLPEVMSVPVIRGLKAFTLTQGQRLANGDLLVGFPGWYRQLAQANVGFPQQAHAVCSSGPVASDVLQQLHQQGLSQIIEVYGSSETSGLGVRIMRDGWYELLPRWQRRDLEHVVDISTNDSVAVPDDLEWRDERHFKSQARKDHAVQVNGYNVYPKRIAALMTEHPSIKEARVRLIESDSDSGLKALIVAEQQALNMPTEALIAQVQSWLAEKLDDAEMPRKFAVSGDVPVNDMGKEIDWELQADLMSR